MPHSSEEFRYSTRSKKVQNVLRAALFFYEKGPNGSLRDKALAVREYNKLAKIKDKRLE